MRVISGMRRLLPAELLSSSSREAPGHRQINELTPNHLREENDCAWISSGSGLSRLARSKVMVAGRHRCSDLVAMSPDSITGEFDQRLSRSTSSASDRGEPDLTYSPRRSRGEAAVEARPLAGEKPSVRASRG